MYPVIPWITLFVQETGNPCRVKSIGNCDLNLPNQTMSNWTVWSAGRYFAPVYEYMKVRQLQAHVNQCDKTTFEVIYDDRPARSRSCLWVHLTGGLSQDPKIIVYEYQKTWIVWLMPDVILRMPSKQLARATRRQSKNRLPTRSDTNQCHLQTGRCSTGAYIGRTSEREASLN